MLNNDTDYTELQYRAAIRAEETKRHSHRTALLLALLTLTTSGIFALGYLLGHGAPAASVTLAPTKTVTVSTPLLTYSSTSPAPEPVPPCAGDCRQSITLTNVPGEVWRAGDLDHPLPGPTELSLGMVCESETPTSVSTWHPRKDGLCYAADDPEITLNLAK